MAPLKEVLEDCHHGIKLGPVRIAIKMKQWTYKSYGELDSKKILKKLSSVLDEESIYSLVFNNCQHFVSAIVSSDSSKVSLNPERNGFETLFSYLLSKSCIIPSLQGVGCKEIADIE